MTSETSTTTSAALTRVSSKMPASKPTITDARVAAACATVREKTNPTSSRVWCPSRPAIQAAAYLPTTTTPRDAAPSARVSGSVSFDGSMIIPVEIRKNGTSSDDP